MNRMENQAIARAKQALKAGSLNMIYDLAGGQDRSNVINLLTDLRHFCDNKNISFFEACEISYQHYLEDKRGDE